MIDKLQERNTFLEEKLSTIQHKLMRVDDTVDKLAHPKVPANHHQKSFGSYSSHRISFDIQASWPSISYLDLPVIVNQNLYTSILILLTNNSLLWSIHNWSCWSSYEQIIKFNLSLIWLFVDSNLYLHVVCFCIFNLPYILLF